MPGLRSKILESTDLTVESVKVPEWGCTVGIRALSGAERFRLIDECSGADGKIDSSRMAGKGLLAGIVDPKTKEPVFAPEDYDALLAKNGAVLDRLIGIASRLNGFGEDEIQAIEKN